MTSLQGRVMRTAGLQPVWRMLLLAIMLLAVPAASAYADAGPKPGMRFTFKFPGEAASIVSGQLIECEDETCASAEALEEVGPQGFTCTETECSSIAYGYAPYHKLVIEFADGTRESNVFEKKAFSARYRVTVTETELEVEEVRSLPGRLCCPSFFVTLVLETLVAGSYVSFFHLPRAMLPWVPLSSLLTLPVVWFVFPHLGGSAVAVTGLSETFAVLAEAGLIYAAAFRRVPLGHVAALSLAMNAASFLAGLVL